MTARSQPTEPPDRRRPHSLILAAAIATLAALALALFAWPQARSSADGVPVGVAGEPATVEAIERGLAASGAGLDVVRYPHESAAVKAIESREVYGALVAGADGPTLLAAPAASAAVAQLLEQTLAAGPAATEVSVVEVVPAPADDPRGAGFAASVLPLILVAMATGTLGWQLGGGAVRTAGFISAAGALAALAAVAVIQGWLGILAGGWLANAAAVWLLIVAIAVPVAALARLAGPAGIGVAALAFVLIGNPWSGTASAPELLPAPLGAIGALLPPGAGADLLRGVAFFDGAATLGSLLVLVAWAAAGLAGLAVAARANGADARLSRPLARADPAAAPR